MQYFNRVLWQHEKKLNATGEHDRSLHHEIQSEINSGLGDNNQSLPIPLCDLEPERISNSPPKINQSFLRSLEDFVDTCVESIFAYVFYKEENGKESVRSKNFRNGYLDSFANIEIPKIQRTPEILFATTLVDGIFKDIFTEYNEIISTKTLNQDMQRRNTTKSNDCDSSSNNINGFANSSLDSSLPKDGYSFIAGQAVRLNQSSFPDI